jgi:hypothetical protein
MKIRQIQIRTTKSDTEKNVFSFLILCFKSLSKNEHQHRFSVTLYKFLKFGNLCEDFIISFDSVDKVYVVSVHMKYHSKLSRLTRSKTPRQLSHC